MPVYIVEPPWIPPGRAQTSHLIITEDESFQDPFHDMKVDWMDESGSSVAEEKAREREEEEEYKKKRKKLEKQTNKGWKKRLPQALIIGAKKGGTCEYMKTTLHGSELGRSHAR